MGNPDSVRSCVRCEQPMQGRRTRKRAQSATLLRASQQSRFVRPGDLQFGASDPVFRSSKFVKGSRLTGSASTASIKTQASGPRASAIPGKRVVDTPLPAAEPARSEPHFDGRGSAFADRRDEELQRQYAFYERFNAPLPRSRPGIVYVIAVFAVGAAVGMAGAWWGSQSSGDALENELPHVSQNVRAAGTLGMHGGAVKGIDPRELPYDGLPPDPSEQLARVPRSGITPEERPYAEAASGNHIAQPARQDNAPSDSRQARKSRQPEADEKTAHAASAAEVKKTVTAKASRKHHSTHRRVAKDREIERIKQQAAEELKKKTDKSRPVRRQADSSGHRSALHHDAPTNIDRSTRTRALLASCEHAGNFFLREKCKWRLCGGSWGEHGCPSYKTQANPY
jgi:hypothetical protein